MRSESPANGSPPAENAVPDETAEPALQAPPGRIEVVDLAQCCLDRDLAYPLAVSVTHVRRHCSAVAEQLAAVKADQPRRGQRVAVFHALDEILVHIATACHFPIPVSMLGCDVTAAAAPRRAAFSRRACPAPMRSPASASSWRCRRLLRAGPGPRRHDSRDHAAWWPWLAAAGPRGTTAAVGRS